MDKSLALSSLIWQTNCFHELERPMRKVGRTFPCLSPTREGQNNEATVKILEHASRQMNVFRLFYFFILFRGRVELQQKSERR